MNIKDTIKNEEVREKYKELSEEKKKIINFIGDRTHPEMFPFNLANGKQICRDLNIPNEKFDKLVNELVYKDKLVSYIAKTSVKWNESNKREREEKEKQEEYNSNVKLRLTFKAEIDSLFNGVSVYKIITKEEYFDLHEKYIQVEEQIDNIRMDLLQAMAIFVAIITLIIGNVQVISTLMEQPLKNILFMVLMINSIILLSIYFLMLTIRNVIFQKKIDIDFKIVIWPIILFVLGIVFYSIDLFPKIALGLYSIFSK
jgi:cation transport ATPase